VSACVLAAVLAQSTATAKAVNEKKLLAGEIFDIFLSFR
jgi:hypothetical protein